MTVRELINALLSYEADEVIEITGENDETYSIVAFSTFSDLPSFEIKKDNKQSFLFYHKPNICLTLPGRQLLKNSQLKNIKKHNKTLDFL